MGRSTLPKLCWGRVSVTHMPNYVAVFVDVSKRQWYTEIEERKLTFWPLQRNSKCALTSQAPTINVPEDHGDVRELHGAGVQRKTLTWSSHAQVLVKCHEKEFKGMTNSKQKHTSFFKAKVHT